MALNKIKRIACGISGGIDSAVSALLLKRKGYEVIGVFMKNWDQTDETGVCSADRDYEDAQYACRKLEIPLKSVDFVKEYWIEVFSEMISDYQIGLTPNPDILCNKRIKFNSFFQYCMNVLGADAVATGHYARSTFGEDLEHYDEEKDARLLKGIHQTKDQSFFLSQIPQFALRRCVFPVGSLTKTRVREIAREAGLKVQLMRRESYGVCFIGERNFQNFISEYVDARPGNILDVQTGKLLGTHQGIHLYTIGQRCKLQTATHFTPFVVEKVAETGDLIVATDGDHPSLYAHTLTTGEPYWIAGTPDELRSNGILACDFRFQHSKPLIACYVTQTQNGGLYVTLQETTRALSPGQFATFYRGDECLGSARITQPGPSVFATILARGASIYVSQDGAVSEIRKKDPSPLPLVNLPSRY